MSLYLLLLIVIGAFNSTTFVSSWNRLFKWRQSGLGRSIVPSWSHWPQAVAMQTIYARFILFFLSPVIVFVNNASFLGFWFSLGILMQYFACNRNRFIKTNHSFVVLHLIVFLKASTISVSLARSKLLETFFSTWYQHYFKIVNDWSLFGKCLLGIKVKWLNILINAES